MYEKVKAYVTSHRMVMPSDVVILGVSGGPDSVCLLLVLEQLSKEVGFGLAAVHVNHGLRGIDADRDEEFVRDLCEKKKIPLMVAAEDVADYAREHRMSSEEAGREVRRSAYHRAMEVYGGTKIALAHHMDDNAETLLLNLARGTGLRGMAGIRPIAGVYIRPLLSVRRKEIEEYLEMCGEAYCTDQTNQEDEYTRNRIRNHVMPYLTREINAKSAEHLGELAEQMAVLSDYIDRQIDAEWTDCVTESRGSYQLKIEAFMNIDDALKPYLVHKIITEAAGRAKDIQAVHVQAMIKLAGQQSGRRIMLPYGLRASRQYGEIVIEKNETNRIGKNEEILVCHPKEEDGSRWVTENIRIRIFTIGNKMPLPEKLPYTKWFDYDIIEYDIVLRNRKAGDYLDIDNMGHTQKLKKYMINARIPEQNRNQVPLIAEGSQILWVVGHRQNQRYQINENTRRILEIQYITCEGEDYGRDN